MKMWEKVITLALNEIGIRSKYCLGIIQRAIQDRRKSSECSFRAKIYLIDQRIGTWTLKISSKGNFASNV